MYTTNIATLSIRMDSAQAILRTDHLYPSDNLKRCWSIK